MIGLVSNSIILKDMKIVLINCVWAVYSRPLYDTRRRPWGPTYLHLTSYKISVDNILLVALVF